MVDTMEGEERGRRQCITGGGFDGNIHQSAAHVVVTAVGPSKTGYKGLSQQTIKISDLQLQHIILPALSVSTRMKLTGVNLKLVRLLLLNSLAN